jgi:hypothetical protein
MANTPICSVNDCHKPAKARGWCSMHYARWLKHGNLDWHRPRHSCSVDGCSSPAKGQGYCDMHYKRVHKGNDPDFRRRSANGEPLAWLESHVDYKGSECLIWPFGRTHKGYGLVGSTDNERYAHRIMCQKVHGNPPTPDAQALHSCGKGHHGCVHPQHVRWGTALQNTDDMRGHGTMALGSALPQTKLTPDQVQEIRSLRGVLPQAEIASRFNTTGSNVCRIQTRKTWAWLS